MKVKVGISCACEMIEEMFQRCYNKTITIDICDDMNVVTRILQERFTRFITEDEARYILTEYHNPFLPASKQWTPPYKGKEIEFFDDCFDDEEEDDDEE